MYPSVDTSGYWRRRTDVTVPYYSYIGLVPPQGKQCQYRSRVTATTTPRRARPVGRRGFLRRTTNRRRIITPCLIPYSARPRPTARIALILLAHAPKSQWTYRAPATRTCRRSFLREVLCCWFTMSKLWRKDGTTVEITRVTPAAGGGESHHSIFGWADDTKETAKTEQSTSQQFYGALAADARIVPAAGVPLCKQDFKLSDGYRQVRGKARPLSKIKSTVARQPRRVMQTPPNFRRLPGKTPACGPRTDCRRYTAAVWRSWLAC